MSILNDIAPGLLLNLVMTAGLIAVCQLLLWLLSIKLRDASIVDIFWGPSFAVVALATWLHLQGVGVESRKAVLLGLTSLWAIRLGCYVYWRSRGHGEDPRYAAFRKKAQGNEHVFMLRHVFYSQGMAMWTTSIPVQVGMFWLRPDHLGITAWIGIAVWTIGFAFETIGD